MEADSNTIMVLNNNDIFLNKYTADNMDIMLSSISLDLNSTNYPLKGNILLFFKSLIMNDGLIQYFDNDTFNKRIKNIPSNAIISSPSGQQFYKSKSNTEFTTLV